jgi:GntR family transcriptional regulator
MNSDAVQPIKTSRLSVQAEEYLHSLIERGAFQPGDQLPSEADLAAQMGISRPTLREALSNLEQGGIVVRKHGVGTFVAPHYSLQLEGGLEQLESILEIASRQGMDVGFRDLEVRSEPGSAELCRELQIEAGAPVTLVNRVIVADGHPVAYMADVVPATILTPEEIDGSFGGSVLDFLRDTRDVKIAQAIADIVSLDAPASVAEKLEVRAGEAVLLLAERLIDAEGNAVGCSQNYFVPKYIRFHIIRR